MPDYQINVVVEIAAADDLEATALADNTRRVLGQYFPGSAISLAVFGKPWDAFSRKVQPDVRL